MTARTIKMDMTWRMAATIIAAALESGTDKGRDAARAELARMADLLDAQREQTPGPQSVSLWEVIAEPMDNSRPAFGQTFTDAAQAAGYARTLRRTGYRADLSTEFGTQPTKASALAEAALFFEDDRLKEAQA